MPQTDAPRISAEIFVYATNKNFLNLIDALGIDKVKIQVAFYEGTYSEASAYLDRLDAALIAELIVSGRFAGAGFKENRFEKFGGSERDGKVESRTVSIQYDPSGPKGPDQFAGYPWRVTVTNGPGIKQPTGAIKPNGKGVSQSLRIPHPDMLKIMLALKMYLDADNIVNHKSRVAASIAEQTAKR